MSRQEALDKRGLLSSACLTFSLQISYRLITDERCFYHIFHLTISVILLTLSIDPFCASLPSLSNEELSSLLKKNGLL